LTLTGGSCSSTTEFFRHGRSRALQKNHSLLAAVSTQQKPRPLTTHSQTENLISQRSDAFWLS
jgi:hypothetical protein